MFPSVGVGPELLEPVEEVPEFPSLVEVVAPGLVVVVVSVGCPEFPSLVVVVPVVVVVSVGCPEFPSVVEVVVSVEVPEFELVSVVP